MKGEGLAESLRVIFIGELEEHVGLMTRDILALEADPADADSLRQLFRSAHTIKGAAHAAGVPLIQQVCHHIETLLAAARDGQEPIGPGQIALLLETVDALADAQWRLRARAPFDDAPIALLVERMQAGVALSHAGASDVSARARNVQPELTPAVAPSALSADTAELHGARGAAHQVRVDADKLDALLASVGEVMTMSRRVQTHAAAAALEDARLLALAAEQLGARARALRMRPFADACEGLPRSVRDIAAASAKETAFELDGANTEVDRAILATLRPALLHLVRNAVVHGVETPEQRVRAGKPIRATVRVTAHVEGDQLIVTVSDDGAGLDLAALRARLGVIADDDNVRRSVFDAGVSTTSAITDVAGRGVGLDAARAAVESLRGRIDVASEPGAGTTFTLELPLTLAVLQVIVVEAGGERVALPMRGVESLTRLHREEVGIVAGRRMMTTAAGPVPLVALASVLGYDGGTADDAVLNTIVINAGGHRLALVVDRFVTDEEVLVRALHRMHPPLRYVMGAAIRSDGDPVLVLDYAPLIQAALARTDSGITVREDARASVRRILVADDSITTRTLLQGALESAGYQVRTAADGTAALALLQREAFDLLVSDVEMPGMDGFTLCEAIRGSAALARLPVVLVTSLDTAQQRARGLSAGANAYLSKSSFDQEELLRLLQQLLD